MAAFVSMLPAKIAANIERGEVPVAGQPTVPLSPVQQTALEEQPPGSPPPPMPTEEAMPARRSGNRKAPLTALPADDQPHNETGFDLGG
jgi:hypothetical protein